VRERIDNLLSCPSGGRRFGHVEVDDLPSMMEQDDEHVQDTEGRGWHDEEVDGDEVFHVVAEE